MSRIDSLEVGSMKLVRWHSRRKFQMRRANVTVKSVRLGSRRQRLTLRRLVRWPVVRWCVVVNLMGPIKKVLLEIASAQRQQLLPTFTLVNHFPFPLVWSVFGYWYNVFCKFGTVPCICCLIRGIVVKSFSFKSFDVNSLKKWVASHLKIIHPDARIQMPFFY